MAGGRGTYLGTSALAHARMAPSERERDGESAALSDAGAFGQRGALVGAPQWPHANGPAREDGGTVSAEAAPNSQIAIVDMEESEMAEHGGVDDMYAKLGMFTGAWGEVSATVGASELTLQSSPEKPQESEAGLASGGCSGSGTPPATPAEQVGPRQSAGAPGDGARGGGMPELLATHALALRAARVGELGLLTAVDSVMALLDP